MLKGILRDAAGQSNITFEVVLDIHENTVKKHFLRQGFCDTWDGVVIRETEDPKVEKSTGKPTFHNMHIVNSWRWAVEGESKMFVLRWFVSNVFTQKTRHVGPKVTEWQNEVNEW